MTPDPKPIRIKLKPAEYAKLRKAVWERACSRCERCTRWTPYEVGHMHHVKRRGAGGDDTPENTMWFCYECHDIEHQRGKR